MTVEVIGHNEDYYFKTDCPDCGCILRFLRVDIKTKTVTDYTGESDEVRYINCPNCGREITKGWTET